MRSRLAIAAATATLAVTGVVIGEQAASAVATGTTVSGVVAPVSSTSSEVLITYTITVVNGPAFTSVLNTTLPAGLAAETDSVVVDGAPVSEADLIDSTPTSLDVRIGSGASASNGGTLADGAHTVRYVANATALRGKASVSAEFSSVVGESRTSVTSAPVAVPLPDLVVSPDPEDDGTPLPLSPDDYSDYFVEVSNRGAATDNSTLTITLPKGVAVDEEDGGIVSFSDDGSDDVPLDCTTAGQVVTCKLGKLDAKGTPIDIPLVSTKDAVPGTAAGFTISAAADNGLEANPADNSVSGKVVFTQPAKLSLSFKADSTRVPVGQSTKIRVTIHNSGPAAANATVGLLAVLDKLDLQSPNPKQTYFRVTGFTGKELDLGSIKDPGDGSATGTGSASEPASPSEPASSAALTSSPESARLQQLRRTVAADRGFRAARTLAATPKFIAWDARTLAPGATVSAVLTVKALKIGTSVLQGFALSADPSTFACSDTSNDCPLRSLTLNAVAAVPAAGPDGNGSDPLANSGVPTGQLTLIGLLALLAGALVTRLGVQQRRGRHRHA